MTTQNTSTNKPVDRRADLADVRQLATRLAATIPPRHTDDVDRAETIEHTAQFLLHILDAGGLDEYLDAWLPDVTRELCICDAYYSRGGVE